MTLLSPISGKGPTDAELAAIDVADMPGLLVEITDGWLVTCEDVLAMVRAETEARLCRAIDETAVAA